ncbi:MAG TPA: hypothetical protein VF268_01975 [Gammaproteobacteria bacterium]
MPRTARTRRLLLSLLIIGALNAPAWAQNGGQGNANAIQQQDIGAGQAARIAQQRHGGKVLKVSREGHTYLVKLLLPSGTVRTVQVSASGN